MNDTTSALLVVVLLGLAGMLVGSFLNVVIHRVPRGESVVRPRSACPVCATPISPRDNIPVLSWVLLGRRCRSCAAPIPWRYPLVELGTGLVWAGLGWWALSDPRALALLPLLLVLSSAGIALTMIDLDVHRLPNAIVLPLYPVTLVGLVVAGVLAGAWPWVPALVGAGLWMVVVGLPWLVSGGRGMGFGDVKLAPILGVTLGWWSLSSAVVGLFAAFLIGAGVGIALMAARRAGRRTAIPFGPFLIGGAAVGLIVGDTVGAGYVGLVGGG